VQALGGRAVVGNTNSTMTAVDHSGVIIGLMSSCRWFLFRFILWWFDLVISLVLQ
jgi:hypothetical protein